MMLPDRDVVRVENRSGRCWVIIKDSSRETFPRVNRTSTLAVADVPAVVNDRGPELAVAGSWHQVELLGLADRCPTVAHTELGVDPVGVGPDGAQGHGELASDVRSVQVGSQQPEHVQFPVAQRLDKTRLDGRRIPG